MFRNDINKLRSFLGTHSELKGDLNIHGVLRLDGAVTGRIEADQVILTETAMIRGEIAAKRIIVAGRVEGTLRAAELLEIRSNGKVRGEIFTNKLTVLEGGEFNGQIEMRSEKTNVLDFESRSQDISLKH